MNRENERPEAIDWVSHPVAEEPRRMWVVPVFALLTGGVMWAATQSLGWSSAGSAVVLLASLEWFLPVHYRLDDQGASRRILFFNRRKSWAEIRRACPDRHGVLLSPFSFATRWESFRGLYLRFSGNREAILGFIARRLEQREHD
jgi:hypothetical protein